MAFKSPVVSPLTESQERLLAQLGSIKNILALPTKKQLSIPEDKQISSFDYMVRVAESIVGINFIETLLRIFITQIFDPLSNKLEIAILKGIANSLDKQGHHVSPNPNESNKEWLMSNALSPLHTTFQIVKALIAKQILTMIFGPKNKMNHDTLGQNVPINTLPSNQEVFDNTIAASSMFSLSNAESNEFGDIEYNTIQLKDELEKGHVKFTISCQDIKISLPDSFDSDVDGMINNIINSLPGNTVGGGTVLNPVMVFDYIGNHVSQETQRINSQENKNAVRKSFLQILVEKILNVLVIAVSPYLIEVLNKINTTNPALNLTLVGLLSSPLELKNLSESDPEEFDKKSVFISTVTNALYAILISIILKALIKEIKKLIKNALAKKASIRLQSKFKRLSKIKRGFEKGTEKIEKAKMAAEALKEFDDIFNYSNIT